MALKVYRTPIGFHDAYVAAPSQKAALEAWGADANLFARGMAEVVTDAELTTEPLARPGEVIKRLRGSVAEQLAAAPALASKPPRRADPDSPAKPQRATKARPEPAPTPRPDRGEVEAAEAALATAAASHHDAERSLAAEEVALAERRRTLRAQGQGERDRLEQARDVAADRYATALRRWQAGP